MMISTRGRYALRVMIDLAENSKDKYVAMKEVATRQNISLKYLERILPALTKNNFVVGVQGKGGGYKLAKSPKDCRVGDILRITEKDLAPVACLVDSNCICDKINICKTRPMWNKLYTLISDYLDSITIEDLMK